MVDAGMAVERKRRRRDKLQAAGLRPIQVWAPDTRTSGFAETCARQAALIREAETSDSLKSDEAWHDASDPGGWTA